jgi:tetratricopeptide (TPR) repeat protein
VKQAIGIRMTVASIMDELGLYVAALDEAEKAAALARTTNDRSALAGALSSLAMAQFELCEYASARKNYEECLKLASVLTMNQLGLSERSYIDLGYGCTLAACGDPDMA